MNLIEKYDNTDKQEELNPIENEIIENYILQKSRNNYDEILKNDTRVEVAIALSELRHNILNWYHFDSNSKILEIDANLGEITGLLCEKTEKVIATEKNIKKAKAISKRFEDIQNLDVLVGDADIIDFEEKFDIIIIHSANRIETAKRHAKEDGKILLITENRFGISYFAGASFENEVFQTIINQDNTVYSKIEIEEILKNKGLNNYKFYYPLPNYKLPNVIFSDSYLPDENSTKMMYNLLYEKGSVVVFDELKALKQVTKNGLFKLFANSYLVEIKMPGNTDGNSVDFISFNNNRKKEYQLSTVLENNQITKNMINDKSKKHIESIKLNIENLKKLGFNIIDSSEENRVLSKYVDGHTLDKDIAKLIIDEKISSACDVIERWYDYLKDKFQNNVCKKINEKFGIKDERTEKMHILKNGYIDIVFENTFLKDDEFLFFDQEWYEDAVPLEFLLYRAIQNLYAYNSEIESKYLKQEMFKYFKIEEYIDIFEEIEKIIQNNIIDDTSVEFNNQSLKMLKDINYTSILVNQINDFEENDRKQNQYIKDLEQDNANKQKYIEALEEDNRNKQSYIDVLEEQTKHRRK